MPYREQIAKFWLDNLPGTPEERLKWLANGNPAGSAIWILAFENDTDELAGTISVMPRQFHIGEETKVAGILGDFMVHQKYRVFGPAVQLIKEAMAIYKDYEIDFIYTIPNKQSEIFPRVAGLNAIGKMLHYVKPLNSIRYMTRYVPKNVATILSYILDPCLRLVSRETYMRGCFSFEEVASVDEKFDALWETFRKSCSGLLGDRRADYIEWKYINNPERNMRIVVARKEDRTDLSGIVVFNIKESCLNIIDIMSPTREGLCGLIKETINIGRINKCYAVHIVCANSAYLSPVLESFRFFTSQADTKVFSNASSNLFDNGIFMSGDRNI